MALFLRQLGAALAPPPPTGGSDLHAPRSLPQVAAGVLAASLARPPPPAPAKVDARLLAAVFELRQAGRQADAARAEALYAHLMAAVGPAAAAAATALLLDLSSSTAEDVRGASLSSDDAAGAVGGAAAPPTIADVAALLQPAEWDAQLAPAAGDGRSLPSSQQPLHLALPPTPPAAAAAAPAAADAGSAVLRSLLYSGFETRHLAALPGLLAAPPPAAAPPAASDHIGLPASVASLLLSSLPLPDEESLAAGARTLDAPPAVESTLLVAAAQPSVRLLAPQQPSPSAAAPPAARSYVSPRERALAARARRSTAALEPSSVNTSPGLPSVDHSVQAQLLLADMARACVGVPSAHFVKSGSAVTVVAGPAFASAPAEPAAPESQLRAALLSAHAAVAAGAGTAFLACEALVGELEVAAVAARNAAVPAADDADDASNSVHQAAARWLAALLRHYASEMMELLRRLQQQQPPAPAAGTTSSVLGLSVALRPWAAALTFVTSLLGDAPSLPPAALVERLYRAAAAEAAQQPLDAALVAELGLPPTGGARAASGWRAGGAATPATPPPCNGLAFGVLRVTLAALMRGAYGALRAAPAAAPDPAQLLPPPLLSDGLATAIRGAPAHALRESARSLFDVVVAPSDGGDCLLPSSDRPVLTRAGDAERHVAALRAQMWRWVGAWLLRVAAASGRVGNDVLVAAASCVADGDDAASQASRLALALCLRTALGCNGGGVGLQRSAEGAAALALLQRVCGTSDPAAAAGGGVGSDGSAGHDSSRPGTALSRANTASTASAASPPRSPSVHHQRRSPLASSPPHASRGGSSSSPLTPGGRSLHRPHSWHGVGSGAGSVVSGVTATGAGAALAEASAASAGAPPLMLLDTSAAARRGRSARSAGVGPRAPLLPPRRPAGARPASAAPSSAASTAGASEWESASVAVGGGSRALRRASSAASVTGGTSVFSGGGGGASVYSGSVVGGSVADGGGSPSGRSLFVSARDRRAAAAAEARAVKAVAQRREEEERAAHEEARRVELARQAADAARAVDDRRAARSVERAADATMVSAAAASAPVAPLRTAVRVTQPSGGATTFDAEPSTRTAVRVTQPAGGAVTLAAWDDSDGAATTKTSVRITQPSGGVSSLAVAAVTDYEEEAAAAASSSLVTSVRVTQPSGGTASVQQMLLHTSGVVNNSIVSTLAPHPNASYSAAVASASGVSTAALDLASVRTHVRVTQPAGGSSTVDALLAPGGERGDAAAVAFSRRPSTAGGSSVLSAVTMDADTDAASTAGSDGASWTRQAVRSGVAISQHAGGVSTVQTLLYGSSGEADASTAGSVARAATGSHRSSRQAILNRLNASRVPVTATSADAAAPADAAVEAAAGPPVADIDEAATAVTTSPSSNLPQWLGSTLFRSDALDAAEARGGSAVATPRGADAGAAASPSTPARSSPVPTQAAAVTPAALDADNLHTLWAPPQLTAPLPVAVRQALTLPLLRRVSLLSSAAVAAVLTVHDLPGHLAALSAWMLMAQGHVFASALDGWLPAATRATAQLGADGAVADAAAAALTGHAHDVAPLLSRAHAAAYANACVGWALSEHGLKGAVDVFDGETARRARLALHAATRSSGGGDTSASLLLRDGDLASAELAALLRQEARANVALPPALSHVRRFRYVAAPAAASPVPPASRDGGGSAAAAVFVTDVLMPVYSLGDDADSVEAGRVGDVLPPAQPPPQAPLLLAHVLTPRVLARLSALHAHLLRLRHVSWALRRTWTDIAAVGRAGGAGAGGGGSGAARRRSRRNPASLAVAVPPVVTLFRHEAGVFLGALEAHAEAQLHGHALPGLLGGTLATDPACATLDGLAAAVDDASVDMLRRCLVPDPAVAAAAAATAAPASSSAHAALSRGAAVLQAALADVLAACHAIREAVADAEAAAPAAAHDGGDGRAAPHPHPLPQAVVSRVTVLAADFRRRAGLLQAGLAALAAAAVGDPRYAFAGELLEALRAAAPAHTISGSG
jgi:hypothetical protein